MSWFKNPIAAFSRLSAREKFHPTWISIFINPVYIVRSRLLRAIATRTPQLEGRLLDFGCGAKPYRELFATNEYVGVDIEVSGHNHEGESIDVYYDGRTLPFESESFDSVFSSEVFEHVFNIDEILGELWRVLKPEGTGLFTVPFIWDEHEVPYDYGRYSSYGLTSLLRRHGFAVVELEKTTNYVETIVQMVNVYIWQRILPKNRVFRRLGITFLCAPITLVGLVFGRLLPKDDGFFHNNVALVRKVQPLEPVPIHPTLPPKGETSENTSAPMDG